MINDLIGDKALGQAGLAKLKEAYAVFSRNQQKYPLVYESKLPLLLTCSVGTDCV